MSLSEQLYQIQSVDRLATSEKALEQRASFIFDLNRAADFGLDDIYEIGCDGLESLIGMNSNFKRFSQTLFSHSFKTFDRILKTEEENKRLNKELLDFFICLGPYFLTSPAGKAIEWLLRRFRIEEFNSKELVAVFLPYHQTKAFLTLITCIRVPAADMNMIGFLTNFRKSRQLLDRNTIVQQIKFNQVFGEYINDYIFKSFKAQLYYDVLVSFYASINVEFINTYNTISEQALNFITPYIFKGLSVKNEGVQVANYLILSTLSNKASFNEEVFEKLVESLVKNSINTKLSAYCFVKLVISQGTTSNLIPSNLLSLISSEPKFLSEIDQAPKDYLTHIAIEPFLFKAISLISNFEVIGCYFVKALASLEISHILFKSNTFDSLLKSYSKYWIQQSSSTASNKNDDFISAFKEVIAYIFSKFPTQMENSVAKTIEHVVSSSKKNNLSESSVDLVFSKIYEIACSRFDSSSGSNQPKSVLSLKSYPVKSTGSALYVSLNSFVPTIRLAAVKELTNLISKFNISDKRSKSDPDYDINEISSLVVERLSDSDSSVLKEVFKLNLHNYLSPSDVVNSVLNLVENNKSAAISNSSEIASVLTNSVIFKDINVGNKALASIFSILLNPNSPVRSSISVVKNLSICLKSSKSFSYISNIEGHVKNLESSNDVNFKDFISTIVMFFSEVLYSKSENQSIFSELAAIMLNSSNNYLSSAVLLSFSIFSSLNNVSSMKLTSSNKINDIVDLSFKFISSSEFLNKNNEHVKESIEITKSCLDYSSDDWSKSVAKIYQQCSGNRDSLISLISFTSLSVLIKCLAPSSDTPKNIWLASYQSDLDQLSLSYFEVLKNLFSQSISESTGISLINGVIIGQLYSYCLKDEWVQFLIQFAMDKQSSFYLRLFSIHVLATFIRSSVPKGQSLSSESIQMVDYQIILPSILVLLSDSDEKIRSASIDLLNSLDSNYDFYMNLANGKSSKKSVKKSKHSEVIQDAIVYKSFEFYGKDSTDLQYLPTDAAAHIVKTLALQSAELESSSSYISVFVQIATGNAQSSAKSVRKLNSKGFGNALVTMVLSHACCSPGFSIPTCVFSRFENVLLEILAPSINVDQYYLLYSTLERYKSAISSFVGHPKSGSLLDKNVRLILSCFNKNIIHLTDVGILSKQGISGEKEFLPFNKFLSLVRGPIITNSKYRQLENETFDSWDNKYKADAYFQSLAFSHLCKNISPVISSDKKAKVLDLVLNISSSGAISTFIPGSSITIKDIFSSLNLSPSMISEQLYSWASKLNDFEQSDDTNSTKKVKGSSRDSQVKKDNSHALESIFSALIVLLEMISSQDPNVKNSPILISPLFELLAGINFIDRILKSGTVHNDLLANSGTDKSISKEYSKQLVINILLDIFNKSNADKVVIDDVLIRVDIIVNVLRSSISLQSQNQALLLLAAIAAQHSDIVLHHVMAIFTFMGDSVLRQDDNYTLHVISQAVVKIIPSLINSSSDIVNDADSDKMDVVEASTEVKNKSAISVLRVFVDSLPYIPQHRRIPLFKLLLETVGVEEYGSYMFILFFEKYSIKQTKSPISNDNQYTDSNNNFSREDYMDFASLLSTEFDLMINVSIMTGLISEMLALPAEKPSDPEEMKTLIDNTVLDIARLNTKQLTVFRLASAKFINNILITNDYGDIEDKSEKATVDKMLESLVFIMLEFVTLWNDQFALLKSKSNTKSIAKIGELVVENNYLMIDYAIGQLDYPLFSRTVLRLFGHQSLNVRRKVIELLSIKIDEFAGYLFDNYKTRGKKSQMTSEGDLITSNNGWSESDKISALSLANLIPHLSEIVAKYCEESQTDGQESSSIDIAQQAILCLSTLAQYFGSLFSSKFLPIFDIVLDSEASSSKNIKPLINSENHLIRSSLFALIARLVNGLGVRAIKYMPKLMPTLLNLIRQSFELLYSSQNRVRQIQDKFSDPEEASAKLVVLDNSTELVAGALVVLENIAKKWSNFLNPYIGELFSVIMDNRVCYLSLHPEIPFLPRGFELKDAANIDDESNLVSQNKFNSGENQYEFARKDLTLRKKAAQCYNNLLTLLSSSVHPRILLQELFKYYESILEDGRLKSKMAIFSVINVSRLVGLTVTSVPNETLITFHRPIYKIFLTMLTCNFGSEFLDEYFRLEFSGNGKKEADIRSAEYLMICRLIETLIDNFTDFCSKLNENTFSPLMLTFIDWATSDLISSKNDQSKSAMATKSMRLNLMYLVINKLFSKLQSIFTPYYENLIGTSIDILSEYALDGDVVGSNGEIAKSLAGNSLNVPNRLWANVLESIRLSALHDSGELWSTDIFERFVKPLGGQVANTLVLTSSGKIVNKDDGRDIIGSEYFERIQRYLSPAITQVYTSVSNDAMWKQMHNLILMKTRSQSPRVRAAGLEIVKSSFSALGEEFLILVPETIPFLSELIDDEDTSVERLTNETIVTIESLLGESLRPYFN
ncbi:HEAT repeat-containing protein 1 [Smittium culicis]|uniref:U3 small nucleolar RNA-associated protein 10 n=1 Tax=Smittium culicis TaxID=133412 RepID=A0A1R1XPV9_9FUNG|nr:HEAT repeat-containing protein 1 [Smittium culicis]